MIAAIINDCRDDNVKGRQIARVSSLLNCHSTLVGVKNDLEAAGNLIDILDALEDRKGVVLVNVAPRNHQAKGWKNGTPFGYFYYKNILVVSTVDGLTLSLVKKLGLIDEIKVLDVPGVLNEMIKKGFVKKEIRQRIIKTQFRSFEFSPRVAAYLWENKELAGVKLLIQEIPQAPESVWFIDNFGNCKTTLLEDDIEKKVGDCLKTKLGEFDIYSRLKDVPNNKAAIIKGSSGIGDKRFLEIVMQGKSAAENFKIQSGDLVI
ncbi:MAG: hypothetical protein GF335_01835 [Candidatus Moranbacteria bacterium]|nr:hypothetical protein [Candidatus Moranbacteria bacterium]